MRLHLPLLPAAILACAIPCTAGSTAVIENKSFYDFTITIGTDTPKAAYQVKGQALLTLEPGGSFVLEGGKTVTLNLNSGTKAFSVTNQQGGVTTNFVDKGMIGTSWEFSGPVGLVSFTAKGEKVTITK